MLTPAQIRDVMSYCDRVIKIGKHLLEDNKECANHEPVEYPSPNNATFIRATMDLTRILAAARGRSRR